MVYVIFGGILLVFAIIAIVSESHEENTRTQLMKALGEAGYAFYIEEIQISNEKIYIGSVKNVKSGEVVYQTVAAKYKIDILNKIKYEFLPSIKHFNESNNSMIK